MDLADLEAALRTSFAAVLQGISEYFPRAIGALLLALVGLMLARTLRSGLARLLGRAESLVWHRAGGATVRAATRDLVSAAVSNGAYWLLVVVFVLAALQVLDLPVLNEVIGEVTRFLPHLVAAATMLFLAIVFAGAARDAVVRALRSAGVDYAESLGRAAQATIVGIGAVLAVGQLGIDSGFLVTLVTVVVTTTLGGAALAFGLGARETVANLLAAHYAATRYSIGQRIRIGEYDGRIVEILDTAVVVETREGRVQVPASLFEQQASSLVEESA